MSSNIQKWPIEIRINRGERMLEIDFDDGETFRLSAEYLRVESPSAEAGRHGQTAPAVTNKENVALIDAEPVGNYAVRLKFDDGHATGLYTWDYLYRLGTKATSRKRRAENGRPRKV